ncbi:MAG: VOC family protein [Woeseiaceae bacterium]
MPVEPYLFFHGRCEEAIEFYKKALGAEVLMQMRFNENPQQPSTDHLPKGFENKVMHACLRIGDTNVMASDGMSEGPSNFDGFSLSLTARDGAEAKRLFTALGNGGKVQQPLTKTFFSPHFGMVSDRFGVSWMVVVNPEQTPQ